MTGFEAIKSKYLEIGPKVFVRECKFLRYHFRYFLRYFTISHSEEIKTKYFLTSRGMCSGLSILPVIFMEDLVKMHVLDRLVYFLGGQKTAEIYLRLRCHLVHR